MTVTRRRFLAISGAVLAAGASPERISRWQGSALGADVSITIQGPDDLARPTLNAARGVLSAVEAQFSLYDQTSALSRLNQTGQLIHPHRIFVDLMNAVDRIYLLTGGLFDPTIQPLWRALAEGTDAVEPLDHIGWGKVSWGPEGISLAQGQALTFNGIAQGFATDLISNLMRKAGLSQTLVNIGEYRAQGGPWKLGVEDPEHGMLGYRTLYDGAIATSSPMAMPLSGQGHIVHPIARPLWSTVTVEADDATTADGVSTAMTMASTQQIRGMIGTHGIRRVIVVDTQGDLTTFSL